MDDITRGEKQQKYRNGPRIVFGVQRKRKKNHAAALDAV